jgi:hypothetical protein
MVDAANYLQWRRHMQGSDSQQERDSRRRKVRRLRKAAVEALPYRRVLRSRTVRQVRETTSLQPTRQSVKLAALVFVQYGLLASDIRFVANANYLGVALANVCIAINTWYLTRGIIEARSAVDRVCFVAGGTAGALVAVLLT